jgi:hypothetical protein
MESLWVFHGIRPRTHLTLLSDPDPNGQGALKSTRMHLSNFFHLDHS